MATIPVQPHTETSAPLVEREGELAALSAALGDPGRLVVVEAPAGMGKSALVDQARTQAEAMGMMALSASGSELERQVAFGVATQLFGPLFARASPEQRALMLEGGAAPARAFFEGCALSPMNTFDSGEGIIQGLYWLTEKLVAGTGAAPRSGPVLIIVDDAHWSDEASLRFLAHMVTRLRGLPVVLLLALRPDEPGANPGLEHLRSHPGAQVLRPASLTEAGVRALVTFRFPHAGDAFARACSHASGGNPFYLGALLEELAAEGIQVSAEAAALIDRLVPSAVSRSILVRLAPLPAPAISLARAVAVLGDRTPLSLAAVLAGIDDVTAEDAADELAGAHLLAPGDPLGFIHPLMGAAVEADLPSFARGRAHRRAAELLAGAGARPDAVAAHLLACRPQGDPWVVGILRAASEVATAAGDHRTAAQLLTRALEEPPGEVERPCVQVALALAGAAAGDPRSDEALDAALTLIDEPEQRASALLTLARLLIGRGEYGSASAAADRGLTETGPDDPLAQHLLTALLMATSRHGPRRMEALQRFEPLVSAARAGRLPDDPILCARLASRMATAGEPREKVAALARAALAAHPLVDPTTHGIPFAFCAAGIYWIDDFVWCKQAADTALDAARRQGSPIALMAASHWQAAACRQMGQLEEAVVHGERAMAIHEDGWDGMVGWTGAVLVATHLDRGDFQAARSVLTVTETTDRESLDWAFVLAAQAGLAVAGGSPAAALANLQAAGRHLSEGYGINHPGVLPWRSQAALAMAHLGRPDQALLLAQEELELARDLGLPRPLGQALRVTGLLAKGPGGLLLLEEAATVLRSSQAALAQAQALVDMGAALRRSGQRTASREPLAQGLRLAESFGAKPLLARAAEELRSAGGRLRSRSLLSSGSAGSGTSLTPTQNRVAQLAAQGLTNPQIAQHLYLTTKTVEWHLGQVYRALHVTGRRQLASVIGPGEGSNTSSHAS